MNKRAIPDLVVFDCDGVLVDTEGPMFDVFAASITAHGLPVTAHELATEFTGGTTPIMRDEATRRGAKLPADWVASMNTEIHARIAQGVDVFDGVLDLITALENAGVPIYVASNGTMKRMSLSLGPCGLWDRLSGRIMNRETFAAKPDPAMILHAIAQTGARPSRSFMIDDSVPGCQAGINAGVHTIGFATEGQDAQLAGIGATVTNSMAEVRRLILG
ncbi:putative haloacid dehalogenase-like hydrolase [Octadecabacter antarcticus 307]|uniref:phosphoglycolate phosphatase n=1 Tax=Octadecabacter antarcticus 307 TaxID=391626 RepID=M9R922_9RHOB|nr:HAD family phosphatase [Octadecabacter antarcticus]AGI66255.1 putative haloacid dehalogenase-like hydrolase [Octadecabacter antarcticus 307]